MSRTKTPSACYCGPWSTATTPPSAPPGGIPFDGFELLRRDGVWRVRSVTAFPNDVPAYLDVYPKFTAALDRLTDRVRAGDFKTPDAATAGLRRKAEPFFKELKARTGI